ncbi:MAG: malonyl-CoA decarboxylase family protein [Paracoccaceae bacterium]|jgi:malonyl-CoA decarboxylase
MSILSDLMASLIDRNYLRLTPVEDDDRSLSDLIQDLLSAHGDVSGMKMARQVLDRYDGFEHTEKRAFFQMLRTALDIDSVSVRHSLDQYELQPTKANYAAFASAAEPKRKELIQRLNQVEGATHRLVLMRADLQKMIAQDPDLDVIDRDIKHLFQSWFNRGFLVLRPINWLSPANVLEKIIAYEAVHAITSWDELRRRLAPDDRRCFAFFHPAMPDEPLIFVEVALTKGIPSSIQAVLEQDRDVADPKRTDTAVFYSISNCQSGLAGISFGNSLIKQVVNDLSRSLPNLKAFVTLSPIPGLRKWAKSCNKEDGLLDQNRASEIAAQYLLTAKDKGGLPLDPVARFHLGNGAMVEAIHNQADLSQNGVAQSAGVMVNYLYDLSRLTINVEKFSSAKEVSASSPVKTLARRAKKFEKQSIPMALNNE